MIITSIITVGALGGVSYYLYGKGQQIEKENRLREEQELDLLMEGERKEEYKEKEITMIDCETYSYSPEVVYNTTYSEGRNKEIEKKKKRNVYNFESPLWQWNLYGTNNLSMYLYFKTTEKVSVRYTVQVADEKIPNFTRTLYNGAQNNLTREHSYQLIGFVPGQLNYVILEIYGSKGKLLNKKCFGINVPKLESGADEKLEVTIGKSEENITNGLYTVFSDKFIWLYDNSGCLRGEIPIAGKTSQKILYYEDCMFYGLDDNRFVLVNALGQVKDNYSLGKYSQYADFIYNGYGQMWILASKNGKKNKSVKDTVIALDMKSKQVTKLFDMENMLGKVAKKGKKTKNSKTFDWISLNAIEQVDSDSVLLSARELSTIFKIENINSREPRIAYMIGEDEIWKGVSYKKKLLKKSGQEKADEERAEEQAESLLDLGQAEDVFFSQVGQSYIQYETSKLLSEGQYYLYVWDSNYGEWNTNKKFNWSIWDHIGTVNKKVDFSYLKKYLVDEKAKTFNLEEEKEIDYTKKNGSMQYYHNHRIDNYGVNKNYGEYDSNGRLIRSYKHNISGVIRIEKMNLKSFLFY